jgi:hypothetical protein
MSIVSYSQFSKWKSCPQQYKLDYIDKVGEYESNIHLVYGTAMHETIQDFLTIMYGETKKIALTINLDEQLLANLKRTFLKEQERMDGKLPCTQEELSEFYKDGCETLHYLKGKLNKFYPKSGYELVAIEFPIKTEVKPGVFLNAYLDIVLKDTISGHIIIIDLKTSTKGWSKYQKNDKVKTSQMLIYKKFYSELCGVPLNDIKVEYHILKNKVRTDLEFPIPRVSKFVPANGKPSINIAWQMFEEFLDVVFDENGKRKDGEYRCNVTRLCDWCSYKNTHCPAFFKK